MFAALGVAALVNGLGHHAAAKARSTFSPAYVAVGVVMLVVGIGYMATSLTNDQWSHEVLEVEGVEITLFVISGSSSPSNGGTGRSRRPARRPRRPGRRHVSRQLTRAEGQPTRIASARAEAAARISESAGSSRTKVE